MILVPMILSGGRGRYVVPFLVSNHSTCLPWGRGPLRTRLEVGPLQKPEVAVDESPAHGLRNVLEKGDEQLHLCPKILVGSQACGAAGDGVGT